VTDRERRRREFLATAAGIGIVGIAGCADDTAETDESTAADSDGDADGETGDGDADGETGDGDADGETGDGDADGETGDGDADGGTGDGDADGGTETPADLDLREANVVGVEVEASGDAYGFDVTLYHDDDGEDGYANWWQVETLDGERLGRRDLRHAHSTAPFTRSETVEVPDDVDCVVVRGHDQTHEYGGQAMTVAVESGETAAVRQGTDRESVAAGDCP
jgi:hypothetical protein